MRDVKFYEGEKGEKKDMTKQITEKNCRKISIFITSAEREVKDSRRSGIYQS